MKTAIVLLMLYALVSYMDWEDTQADQAHYCEMVKAKTWPDYRGTYRQECPK
jgi:hypothetical protein